MSYPTQQNKQRRQKQGT